jgi:uncharacterized membrane protein YdjX (TVP38/TMEM64 family)
LNKTKLMLLAAIAAAVIAIIFWLPTDLLTLENLKSKQNSIADYQSTNPVKTALVFCLTYILMAALSIPGAAILTIAAGAIFGVVQGSLWASISSTIGATLAFLMARYFFRDAVERKMGNGLQSMRDNLEKDGSFYLFSLRLVPVVPFFVINLLMGLTPIKVWHYVIASWAGMLLGTAVYVNAGTQLSKLESLKGILSPSILLSFVLLAVFPHIARYLLKFFRKAS